MLDGVLGVGPGPLIVARSLGSNRLEFGAQFVCFFVFCVSVLLSALRQAVTLLYPEN